MVGEFLHGRSILTAAENTGRTDLRGVVLHDSPFREVRLVSQQQLVHALAGVSVNLRKPALHVLIRL